MNLFRQHAHPKDEHPRKEEWDEIKGRAKEQGLLHNDGTFADPPRGGSSCSLPTAEQAFRALTGMFALPETLDCVRSKSGRSNSAVLALMKTIEEGTH